MTDEADDFRKVLGIVQGAIDVFCVPTEWTPNDDLGTFNSKRKDLRTGETFSVSIKPAFFPKEDLTSESVTAVFVLAVFLPQVIKFSYIDQLCALQDKCVVGHLELDGSYCIHALTYVVVVTKDSSAAAVVNTMQDVFELIVAEAGIVREELREAMSENVGDIDLQSVPPAGNA